MKKTLPKNKAAMDAAIAEDLLITGLLKSIGEKVEVIAFGIGYIGKLLSVDVDDGVIVITDGDDRAMIEIERIESFSPLG